MKLFALIGHPLSHSFSQAYFTEKFAREKVDACYENFDLSDIQELPGMLRERPDLCGFNVTIPYKEAIIPFLDELDPEAETVGAVNTVKVMADGRMKGFNTDIIGIEASLGHVIAREERPKQSNLTRTKTVQVGLLRSARNDVPDSCDMTALILGTGGASKAVQYVLEKHHIPYHLVSRTPGRGQFTYETLTPEVIQNHLLIINATPVGMAPHIEEAPLIPYEALTEKHVLFDLIYNPEETRFLQQGKAHSATTINGLTMLHAQAEASWAIWNQ